MVSRGIIGGVLAISVLLAAKPTQADITLKVSGSDGLNPTIQVRNGKGRMSADGMSEYLIYDSRTETITYVEPQQQQYTQVTVQELEATVQMAESMKQSVAPYMDNMLAGLSAQQRERIEQRMGGIVSAPAAGKPAAIRTVPRGRLTGCRLNRRRNLVDHNGGLGNEVAERGYQGNIITASDCQFAFKKTWFESSVSHSLNDRILAVPGTPFI